MSFGAGSNMSVVLSLYFPLINYYDYIAVHSITVYNKIECMNIMHFSIQHSVYINFFTEKSTQQHYYHYMYYIQYTTEINVKKMYRYIIALLLHVSCLSLH